jgi:hypothetical protein
VFRIHDLLGNEELTSSTLSLRSSHFNGALNPGGIDPKEPLKHDRAASADSRKEGMMRKAALLAVLLAAGC